ncbi:hypothetical protein GcC1_00681 [Golovinomyces cichoracearum]|uniref:Uncharacterized protein n=1 Tax=Golovinomyces cichoracearum TaxID=62708 RepID=A0A420J4W9_9PEZI|nr:hypothetical protein GcC1_00681 [Golovinomyces cichoracearum]
MFNALQWKLLVWVQELSTVNCGVSSSQKGFEVIRLSLQEFRPPWFGLYRCTASDSRDLTFDDQLTKTDFPKGFP